MPAYNAERWIEPTIKKIHEALQAAGGLKYEIVFVDDGSNDSTLEVARKLARRTPHLTVLTHANKGRFLTRKRGVMAARYDTILFVDTRVWLDKSVLKFLKEQRQGHPDRRVWNGHIFVAKQGNIIARFGDSLTLLGWRRYFRKPHLTSYGIKDFDFYPKGTGLFVCPKDLLIETIEWFEANTTNIAFSSDDTLMIRHIAEKERIWLSPDFSATYFARTTLSAFAKHTYFRGQFFVDGFLRPGTRFYYPLLAFLLLSPIALVVTVLFPWLLFLAAAGWMIGFFIALLLGLSLKDAASLIVLSPVFVVFYSLGIWRATIRLIYNMINK